MQIPTLLRAVGRRWRALAVKLGHFNGLALLTILYWIVIGIVGVLFRLLRQDPLGLRSRPGSAYQKKELQTGGIADYRHLY